jgi:hypothetical protein
MARQASKIGAKAFDALKPRQKRTRTRVLRALEKMRKGDSATVAAKKAHTTVRSMKTQLGDELNRTESGRYAATKADRLYTVMNVVTTEGTREVAVRGSRQRSKVAKHFAAVRRFLRTGDDEPLRRFEGEKVGGFQLETDPEVLEEGGRLSEYDFPELYAATR